VSYQCPICGEIHKEPPDLNFRWPDPGSAIPESERATRIKGNSDTCVIDGGCYVRGTILIPITGTTGHLAIGIWASQSAEDLKRYLDNFDSPKIGPFFGLLGNNVPFYKPGTLATKVTVHFQGQNMRPLIRPEPSDHALHVDYTRGITLDRAWEIAHAR
jgi:hypothetical protein